MKGKINSRVSAALLAAFLERNSQLELLADLADQPLERLMEPDRLIPNETMILLFGQARQLADDPELARRAGVIAGQELLTGREELRLPIFPEPRSLERTINSSLRKLFPQLSVKASSGGDLSSLRRAQSSRASRPNGTLVSSGGDTLVSVRYPPELIFTHDYCLFIQGVLQGLVENSGAAVSGIKEEACQLSVDQAGPLQGERYRLDDQGGVWLVSAEHGEQVVEEKFYGRAEKDGSHLVAGVVYGSHRCLFRVAFIDRRGLARRWWERSGGKALNLLRLLRDLDRNRFIDADSYHRVADEYRGWVKWEPSYQLTKVKYLAYFGVLCLALLPLLGGIYYQVEQELLRTILAGSLTALILMLGFLVAKLQLDYSRNLLDQNKESQQLLRHAGVGVTIIRPDYTIEFANPQVREAHGEVKGKKCYEALRWRSDPCPDCLLKEVLNGTPQARMEQEYLNSDGQRRWYQVNSTPIMDAAGQVNSVINISADITDRRLLEIEILKSRGELEASEAKYRNFMANAADAIIISDLDHRVVEANRKAEQLLNGGLRRCLKKNLFETDLLPLEDRIAVRELLDRMIADRAPRAFETKLQPEPGRSIEVEVRAIPIIVNDQVAWVQSILRDITERKQQEFEKSLLLSISNAIKDAPDLEAMIDQALSGICQVMQVPISAIFLRVPGEQKLKLAAQVGLSSQAVRKMAILAVDGSAGDVASRTAILKRPIVIGDLETIKAGEHTRERIRELGVSSLASVPMLMEDELQGVIYIASRDQYYFTPRRLAVINQVANELAVGIARQRLRDLIQEKNRELTEKNRELANATVQLLQSEKMASIGQLAAGVAHEINNPMGYINSNLNLLKTYRDDLIEIFRVYQDLEKKLQEQAPPDELKERLEKIRKLDERINMEQILSDVKDMISESIEGAERVTYIVKSLKEFSHPDAGRPQMCNLHQALESTLNIVWNELKYKAEVKKEFGEIPAIPCHLQELKQVFMNLLVNASQAIPRRGEIRLKTFVKEGFVNIQIQDTGTGMSPDQLPRIFDPFYTTKEVGKGTGLGLSISYNIVKKHGGTIEVESEPGRGSTFTVKLPLNGAPDQNQENETPQQGPEDEIGASSYR